LKKSPAFPGIFFVRRNRIDGLSVPLSMHVVAHPIGRLAPAMRPGIGTPQKIDECADAQRPMAASSEHGMDGISRRA
jgi:hypothetical protein